MKLVGGRWRKWDPSPCGWGDLRLESGNGTDRVPTKECSLAHHELII